RVLLDHARSRQCRRVVVVGGGYIGLEMAEAFCRWGAEVTIVERQAQLMGTLDPDIAARLVEPMEGLGIEVRLNTAVAGFEPGAVLLDGEERLDADLVVLGLGVTPNAELAADAGVATGARGALSVDRRQRTNLDGVFAAGDRCESWHLVYRRTVHVALGTHANKKRPA